MNPSTACNPTSASAADAAGPNRVLGNTCWPVAGPASRFVQSSAQLITRSVLAIGTFSAFILDGLKRVQGVLQTHCITATRGIAGGRDK